MYGFRVGCKGALVKARKIQKIKAPPKKRTAPISGNPMYHWCHLELARYFGVTDKLLGPDTAL